MPWRKLDLENGIVKKKQNNNNNDRENVTWMNNVEATINYMLSSLLFAFSFVVIQTRRFNEDIKI